MGKLIPQRIAASNPNSLPLQKPALLSPAGDWECARAAVENGADAIYFGLSRFNARLRANNFTEQDLPELMRFLHERGVKGYVTFNTLLFTSEVDDALHFLRSIIASGVDAAIVQDVGVCRLIRALSPDFPIHASTQMSITSEAGVSFARELGCSVAVLARECSLKEVAAIRNHGRAAGSAIPLEIFVHGALCVAYSGQCLTSEALGGRSANRGECAQACRMPYALLADGAEVDLGDKRYLLSPQDLAGVDLLPDIILAGVDTLKIEGRLKTPEYVAAVTKVYRKAIDQAYADLQTASQPLSFATAQEDRYALEMTFSRGLSTGWLQGIDNQQLVHARFGKKRGQRLGVVIQVDADGVWLQAEPEVPVAVGDGVVFDAGRPDLQEQGGRIFNLRVANGRIFLGFQRGSVQLSSIRSGNIVWKTSDPALDKQLRQSFQVEQPAFKRPISVRVKCAVGEPLQLMGDDLQGSVCQVESDIVLPLAEGQPTTEGQLHKQLNRLGDSPFFLAELHCEMDNRAIVPASVLNQMRRDLVRKLLQKRSVKTRWQCSNVRPQPAFDADALLRAKTAAQSTYLVPYVRTIEQLQAVCPGAYREIYIELEDPRRYQEAVAIVRALAPQSKLWIAPPRIYKTGEEWIMKRLEDAGADGILARNHEHLRVWQGREMRGDFSLNVANPYTAAWLVERWQLKRLTVSYDLNAVQVADLLSKVPAGLMEITLHQHMPMFHMEHCVFCAFLSDGKDFRDCGRPCDKHQVQLKDRVGQLHPLKADAGCRNTLFNARAQTGAEFADSFAALGAAAFRIEFLNEAPDEVLATMASYQDLLAGKISGADLWRRLRLINQLGVTRGTHVNL